MKLYKKIIVIALSALTGLSSAVPVSALGASAYVKSPNLNVRKKPSASSKVVANLKKKKALTVLSTKKYKSKWLKVKTKSGKKGYVHKSYIKVKSNQLLLPETVTGYSGYSVNVKNAINTTKKSIKWTSSDKNLADVNSGGKIICRKAGKVSLKAKAKNKTASCKLIIKNATVKFKKSSYSTPLNRKLKVKAVCKKSVTYKSSNTSVATVSSGGVVSPKKKGTVKITAQSKSGSSALCSVKVTNNAISASISDTSIYKGCRAIIKASGSSGYTYSSSNTNVATVNRSGLITGVGAGKASITVKANGSSVSKDITVVKGSGVNISLDSDTVNKDMTLVIKSSTKGVKWKSTDTSVATVANGYVLAKNNGTAIIRAYKSGGANDCVVKVVDAEPVKFVYTSENSALRNKTIKLYALTDNRRTDVKFRIIDSANKTSWVTSHTKAANGSGYIWTFSKKVTTPGYCSIKAFSKTSAGAEWKSCSGGEGRFFVNKSTSRTACAKGERLITTKVINHIAEYEGFLSKVAEDELVADSPTVGYGRVVYSGTKFYNGLTKKDAFAYLVQTLNDSLYTTRTNQILKKYKISFNQNHFDALVDLAYNLGPYMITNHKEMLSTLTSTYGKSSYKNTGYINKPSVVMRKSAKESSKKIKKIKAGTIVKLVSKKVYKKNWYKIKYKGKKGYIKKNQITKRTTKKTVRNLKNVPVKKYAKNYLKFHHASQKCYKGLLYRRLDELEIFFFNEYDNDARKNSYGISFTCPKNSGFHL